MFFVKLLRDGQAAVQAAIAGENLPTSPHGDSTDHNIDRAGLDALVSAFVVHAGCELVIGSVDRLVKVWIERGFQLRATGPRLPSGVVRQSLQSSEVLG